MEIRVARQQAERAAEAPAAEAGKRKGKRPREPDKDKDKDKDRDKDKDKGRKEAAEPAAEGAAAEVLLLYPQMLATFVQMSLCWTGCSAILVKLRDYNTPECLYQLPVTALQNACALAL